MDEEGYADGRLATKATFMANYGFTAEDAASGLYPFLTHEMVLRVDKGMSDDTYGATYLGIDWFEESLVNPNRVVEDLAFYLFPALFPELNQTVFMRNVAKGEVPVVSSAADCALSCEDDAMLAPHSNPCVVVLPPAPASTPPVVTAAAPAVVVARAALLATVRYRSMDPPRFAASLRLPPSLCLPAACFCGRSRSAWGLLQLDSGQVGGAVYTLQPHSLRSYLPPENGRTGFH